MVVVTAEDTANGPETSGRVALYGIYFDTDKAEDKADLMAPLEQIADLMKGAPKLAVIVVGHTDNQGAGSSTISTSSSAPATPWCRHWSAVAVSKRRDTLGWRGVMAPVFSNEADDGCAKNRRVELLKFN